MSPISNGLSREDTSALQVPVELTDHIISFLSDNPRALCSCGLVCHAWLPASRYHMFIAISLESGFAFDSLVKHVLHSEHMHPFLHLVQHLSIKRTRSPPFFSTFSGHLPKLRTIHLFSLGDWLPHISTPFSLAAFTSVYQLEIEYTRLPSFIFLCRCLIALPNLTHLYFREVTFSTLNISPAQSLVHSQCAPAVTELHIHCRNNFTDHFTPWFVRTSSTTSLKLLHYSTGDPQGWRPSASLLLQSINPALKELEILSSDRSPVDIWARFTALSRLGVYIYDLESRATDGPTSNWESAAHILQDVRSPVRHLYFSVRCHRDRVEDVEDLRVFDTTNLEMLQPIIEGFEKLKKFTVMVYADVPLSCDTIKKALASKLPVLAAKGITPKVELKDA